MRNLRSQLDFRLFLTVLMFHLAAELKSECRSDTNPSPFVGRRDGPTVCDTDRCCPAGQFCAALTLACAPCSQCVYDGDTVGFSCRARCGASSAAGNGAVADLRPPELLWLSLNPGSVDASAAPQTVQILFGVQVRVRLSAIDPSLEGLSTA